MDELASLDQSAREITLERFQIIQPCLEQDSSLNISAAGQSEREGIYSNAIDISYSDAIVPEWIRARLLWPRPSKSLSGKAPHIFRLERYACWQMSPPPRFIIISVVRTDC
jgi:hypothetical protein